MELIVDIRVIKHIPDEEYKELFDSEEELAADIELFKQETTEDIEEIFPNSDNISVNIVGVNIPNIEE